MIDVNKTIALINPWSGSDAVKMTRAQIVVWCLGNVHSKDRHNWIERARRAFHRGDGEKLGEMIIGREL